MFNPLSHLKDVSFAKVEATVEGTDPIVFHAKAGHMEMARLEITKIDNLDNGDILVHLTGNMLIAHGKINTTFHMKSDTFDAFLVKTNVYDDK